MSSEPTEAVPAEAGRERMMGGDMPQIPDIGFTVASVARRLGIASATLRTWARRYGLGASLHTPGAHRRYTEHDVQTLERVQQLVSRGVPLATAAASVLAGIDLAPISGEIVAGISAATGGVVVAMPDGPAVNRGLERAAAALDSAECSRILSAFIAQRGVIAAWDELIRPVLVRVGEKWAKTQQGIEVEHALSQVIITVLAHTGYNLTHPANSRPVILACATHEEHSLPLYAIYAALAERRIAARVLGACVPADSLARAIDRTGPAAVVVWSHVAGNAEPSYLQALPTTRPSATLIAAGNGWSSADTGSATRVADLSETVVAVTKALHL